MSRRNKVGLAMVVGGLVTLFAGVILLVAHTRAEFGETWMGVTLMILAFVLILGSPLENAADKRERYVSEAKVS